jgi:nucleotide-binding universal stress UspA family protein
MYKRILVPVDGSAPSRRGLDEALMLASELPAQLCIVHVVNELIVGGGEQLYFDYPTVIDSLRAHGKRVLEEAEALARSRGVVPQVKLIEAVGSRAARFIVEAAEQWPADLIVMGTHGRRGLSRWALGSDAESVLRSATMPVLLVRQPE